VVRQVSVRHLHGSWPRGGRGSSSPIYRQTAEDIGGVFVSVDVTNTEQIEAAVKGS
jgi:hypothetical protein